MEIKNNKEKFEISKREGLILYWCEGDKISKNHYLAAITSSDVYLIIIFIKWLKKYFKISNNQIRLRLHLWPDSNESEAKNYWAKELKLPINNFTKSYIKDKSGKNKKYKYGICRAGVYSKEILESIIKGIKKEFC